MHLGWTWAFKPWPNGKCLTTKHHQTLFCDQIFYQFVRAISRRHFLNERDAKKWILTPVKSSCRQPFNAEQHMKAEEGFHFIRRPVIPFAVWLRSDAFPCISVRFSDNLFYKFFWKHQIKKSIAVPSSATPEVGPIASVNGETSTGFGFSFHVSSSSSSSSKSERSSVETEETEIPDSESLGFLASNLACLQAATTSLSSSSNQFAFARGCHQTLVAIFTLMLSESLSRLTREMKAKTLFYWLKNNRAA